MTIEPLFTVKLQRPTEYPFTTHPTSVLARYQGNAYADLVIPVNAPGEEIFGPYEIVVEHTANLDDAEDLGKRAAKLVQSMLRDCGKHLSGRVSFGELNDVLYEAQKRGWIEP